ncbi:hypothetical protein ACFL6F_02985 [Planctomycetota bacterium]
MKCKVYDFKELEDCYIMAPEDVKVSHLHKIAKNIPGKPVFDRDIDITEQTRFLLVDAKDVVKDIEKQGYFINRPPEARYNNIIFIRCEYCNKVTSIHKMPKEIDSEKKNETYGTCLTCFKKRYPKAYEEYRKNTTKRKHM